MIHNYSMRECDLIGTAFIRQYIVITSRYIGPRVNIMYFPPRCVNTNSVSASAL